MNPEFQRELLAFDEKIALAELEESKASERVKELEYQKSRFTLDAFCMSLKEQQQKQAQATQEKKQ
jgi:hypothetical protein